MTDTDEVVIEPEDEAALPAKKLKKLRDELKRAKREAADNLAGWQRSKADYVNLSKRLRETGETAAQAGLVALARSVVSVFDSLEAALKTADEAPEGVRTGLAQVEKQLESALKEHDVVRYTPTSSDTFDPERHEPMQVLATEDEKEDNTIAETYQSGYERRGTVVRPARVAVKRYQPKAPGA